MLHNHVFLQEPVEEAEKSEAAAQPAANELMQQEDAEAAKAAAKKAKKLKQKAKKQQAQRQLAPASSAADSSTKSDDEAEPHEDRVDDAFQRLDFSSQTASASDVADDVGSRRPQGLNCAAPKAETAAAQGLNGAASGAGSAEAQGPNGATPEPAVDESFLQGLFSCPITKVFHGLGYRAFRCCMSCLLRCELCHILIDAVQLTNLSLSD